MMRGKFHGKTVFKGFQAYLLEKRSLLFQVREKSGNLRKMLQIRGFDCPRSESGQFVIDSFSNSMFTRAYGEERMAVREEGWPLLVV